MYQGFTGGHSFLHGHRSFCWKWVCCQCVCEGEKAQWGAQGKKENQYVAGSAVILETGLVAKPKIRLYTTQDNVSGIRFDHSIQIFNFFSLNRLSTTFSVTAAFP